MADYHCSFCNKYIKKNYWEYYCADCTRVKSLVKTIPSKKLLESVKIKFLETEVEEEKKEEIEEKVELTVSLNPNQEGQTQPTYRLRPRDNSKCLDHCL